MRNLTFLDIVIFSLYVIAVVILGVIASLRKNKSKRDYFLAGDQMPWWMIGGSIVAANISSHHLVGALGGAYKYGFIMVCNEWGAIFLGLAALLWIFLPFYLRNGFYTMPEFLQRRFGTGPRIVFALLILLTYLFVEISGVLVLGAIVFQNLMDIPLRYCIVILAVATGIYTVTGGLRAVIWTEMLQLSVLMMGGIALAIATFHAVGGVGPFLETQKDWHLILPADDPNFPWTMYLGGFICISVFYFAANQFVVQRVLSAKNEWQARMGVVFTCYLKFLIPLIIVVPGLLAGVMIQNGQIPQVEKPDMIFSELVKDLLPHGLVGLVLAGLVAAIMGHISGAINSCSTIATIDFYLPYCQWVKRRRLKAQGMSEQEASAYLAATGTDGLMTPAAAGTDGMTAAAETGASGRGAPTEEPQEISREDRQAIFFGRCFGVFCILVGILWAELLARDLEKPIYMYLLNAYGYFTPGIAAMFLMGIFWKRTTYAGAVFAGLATIPLTLLMEEIYPKMPFLNRTGIVFWLCMLGCFLISLVTKPRPESEIGYLIWNRESLKLPENERVRGLKRPGFWYIIILLIVLSFFVMYP